MDAAAAAVASRSIGCPALTTPLRTSSPVIRSTGSGSPVSADSSSTAGDSNRPSTGTISPVPTSSRSPTATSSTGTSTTPPSTWRRAVRGARWTSRLNSRRARAAARASSSCPLASITVIIAPANGSLTTSAPASARTAMTSTLNWPRRIDATIQPIEKTRPSTVPAIHSTFAVVSASSSHATPPATNNTVDTANSAHSLYSRHQLTAGPFHPHGWTRGTRRTSRPQSAGLRSAAEVATAGTLGARSRATTPTSWPSLITVATAGQGRRSQPTGTARPAVGTRGSGHDVATH